MERLQRIKELVEQKLKIDKELADIKNAVNAERAAFASEATEAPQEKAGQPTLGSRISKAPAFGAFRLRVHGASHPSSNPHLPPITSGSRHSSRVPFGQLIMPLPIQFSLTISGIALRVRNGRHGRCKTRRGDIAATAF